MPESPWAGFVIWLVVADLFILQTRFFDFYVTGYRIPMVIFLMLALVVGAGVLSQLNQVLNPSLLAVFAALGWTGVATVFSTWRSNSFQEFNAYLYGVAVSLGIILFARTPKLLGRVITASGLFFAIAALLSLAVPHPESVRLHLLQGTYADPNLYALCLLVGLPLLWWTAVVRPAFWWRIVTAVLTVFMMLVILRTSSRGAAAAMAVTLLVTFWRVPGAQKLLFALVTLVGLSLAPFFLSTYSMGRLFTLFEATDAQELTQEELQAREGDTGSTQARQELLIESLMKTLTNPLFGLGPGNFGTERWREYKERTGQNITAFTTHNTYTQWSSETGIPGLVFFLSQIFIAWRSLSRVRKWNSGDGYQPPVELRALADYLNLSLLALIIGMFFLSLAYTGPFLFLYASSIALAEVVNQGWRRYQAQGPAPQPIRPSPLRIPTHAGMQPVGFSPTVRMRNHVSGTS